MMKIFGYFRRNNVFHPSKRPHELLDNLLKNRSLKQYRLRSEEPCSLQRGRHSTATNNSVKHFFPPLKPKDEAHRQVAYLTAFRLRVNRLFYPANNTAFDDRAAE